MKIIVTECSEEQGQYAIRFLAGRKPLIGLSCSISSSDITLEYRSSVPKPARPLHHFLGADA